MKTNIKYYDDTWKIGEERFEQKWLAKYETILSQGNGYMGIRAATEESYVGEKRNTFVAGTFNKFDDNEVSELPNVPDFIHMAIHVNGHPLDLNTGNVKDYERALNFKNGELIRSFVWEMATGEEVAFTFKRFVSKKRLHVFGQKVIIQPLTDDVQITIETGINGQVTNSGTQHFTEGDKRLHENKYLQMRPQTIESNIDFVLSTGLQFEKNNQKLEPETRIEMERRKISNLYWINLQKEDTLTLEKISNVHTSRDKEHTTHNLSKMSEIALEELKTVMETGYDKLFEESSKEWRENVWEAAPITISSSDFKDQLAIHFATYHLHVMTPAHDDRMNIGAKGLSGEGYKGHTFWDTEIFLLPYFTYTHPDIAKSLVSYRYHGLEGARNKAKENGFYGAQYPWEAAWITDGETTPVWGAADIVTGEATKILSGFIEQHITGDVAYGVQSYVDATGDMEFMEKYGYEIILDTANFWASRVEYDEQKEIYVINNVIGPDEYKEEVDNNAFTNYIAHWNMKRALEILTQLGKGSALYKKLSEKINLENLQAELEEKIPKIYLPKPNEDGIIPQDDTYLSKKVIDLQKYKEQEFVGGLFHDYNLEQVNNMQITKQADVLLLVFLFENLFSKDIKEKNWYYYEPKTLHDSSLSLSTHAVLAADLEEIEMAYELFKEATEIDMGPAMHSSDEGIHAASLGGIWQAIVFGFGGVRALDNKLRINPHLPKEWKELSYVIFWHQNKLQVVVKENQMTVKNLTGKSEIEFESFGKQYKVEDSVTIDLKP